MKFGFALASLVLALGCSKSSDTVPITSAPVTTDPSLAPTAADRCFDDCDKKYAAGSVQFDNLDLCMETNCKQLENEPTTAAPACAPIDDGSVSYNYAPSDHCMARVCCGQAQACVGDANCGRLSACFSTCSKLR